jgi:hypothetical protein
MSDWPGVTHSRLTSEGSEERNGLGAIRVVRARGLDIHEEVVHFDRPNGYEYKITKGLPVKHLGSAGLTDLGGGTTRLAWDVRLSSRLPLAARLIAWQIAAGLPKALDHFKREVERAAKLDG